MSKTPAVITREQLEAVRVELAALPPKQKTTFSNREAIAELAADIRHASENLGYSLPDIAALLKRLGHPLEASTLRSYMRALETATDKKKPASPRKGKARMPLLDLSSEVQAGRNKDEAPPVPRMAPPAPPLGGQARATDDTPLDQPAELPPAMPAAMEGARDG